MRPELNHIASFVIIVALLVVTTSGHSKDTGYRSPEQVPGANTVSAGQAKRKHP
jgi:hypothetical protein